MAQWGQSRHRQAQRYLEQALAEFEAQNDEQGCGETMVQLSIVHQTQGDFAPAIQYINTALSQQISARSRCQSHLALAWLALAQSQVDLAATHLNTAYSLAEASQDEGAINICMMQTRFPFQCVPSGYKLFPRLTTLLERQQPAPMSPRRAAIFGAQMFVHFLAGNVAQAIVAGEQARHISQQLGGLSWLMMDTGAMLAILYSIRGDQYRFDELVQENERLTERFTGWRRTSLYLYGYCYWSHNWLDKMEAMFAQMQAALPNEWPSANVC
jgi:tetratricopeptide (TPR) repeat protein